VIYAKFGMVWATLALLIGPVCALAQGGAKFPRYCLTIAIELRPGLRERVSMIDLTIENGSVVAIPRFPAGWEIKIQNQVDISPALIFGGATGAVAELGVEDMKCLFEIENSVPGRPPINVNGKVTISTGTTESEVVLGKSQILLQPIAPALP
jgi:hypothetical protein